MIFTPQNGRFADFTHYTLTIDTTAVNTAGDPLFTTPYYDHLYTDHYADTADFGGGPDIQVVAVNGRRAVHYRGYDLGVRDVQFDLYHVPTEKFAERYAARNWNTDALLLAKSWSEQTRAEGEYYLNPQELIIPADVPPGAYILNLSGNYLNDQLFILLTGHQLTLKQSAGQIAAWVDGPARAESFVRLYADDGALLAEGRANADGLFTADLANAIPAFATAQQGSEIIMTGFSYAWGGYDGRYRPSPYQIHIATDRPIYKPGDTVYFKAILRSDEDAALAPIPEGTAVTARLFDARGNRVQTLELSSSDYGTAHGSFLIGDGATVGNYKIEITLDGVTRDLTFKVEDYRKPDYQVTAVTDSQAYLVGDDIAFTVDSQYFFGEPLANAETTLIIYDRTWYYNETDLPAGQTVQLDENGRFTTTIPAKKAGQLIIEAIVDDGSSQAVAAQAIVQVHDVAETMTIQRGSFLKTPGTAFTVNGSVQDIWQEPVNGRSVTLKLTRYSRSTFSYSALVDKQTVVTDENGRFTTQITPDESGYYKLIATATDRLGSTIESTNWIVAYSSGYRNWTRRSDDIGITPDQDSYQPGDTAQLFIESSMAGPALLTLERGAIHSQQVVELTPPLTIVKVPITAAHTPNIYAAIHAWKPLTNTLDIQTSSSIPDASLVMGRANLSVPAQQKNLTVVITPDKETYAPGDEATFTIRVTNPAGDPVAAEVALAVVDEAIFALSADNTPDLYDTFYFERGNSVGTYDSMRPTRSLWIPFDGGMGGGGGDDGNTLGNPRQDFQDTAVWYPALRTDFNGETAVTFTLPDNLTSWRITARVVTADTQIGQAVENVTVRQDILIRPLLPRILTAGDQMILSALIHNYTDKPQEIRAAIVISPSHVSLTGDDTQTIAVPAGAAQIVGWPITAAAPGDVSLTLAASPTNSDIAGDAVRLPLTIQPLAIPDVATQVGQFEGRFTTEIDMPANALDMSTIHVTLSRSIAGSLTDGLEYLTGYPYGCVEQTMSRALPNAVVGRAFYQLGVGDPGAFAALEPKIQASIQRLYGFQHGDGGWGWWYNDPTHDYQTAWVVFGLSVTAAAGYEVDPAVIERGVEWLNDNLDEMDSRTRAYALYSMAIAGQGNLEAALALAEQVDELDTFSQAALALALHELGQTVVSREILDLLAETAVVSDGYAHWQGDSSDGYYHHKTMASDLRSTALALSAFAHIQPGHPLEAPIARWLMGQRRAQGWGTTNETSFTILALTDHLLNNPEFNTPSEFTISLNGEMLAEGVVGPERPFYNLEIPATTTSAKANEITITSSSGKLYYTISRRAYIAQNKIAAAGNVQVRRTYHDPHTGNIVENVQAGDVVEVHLAVTLANDATYVIVEDKLPGGLEALNENLDTTSVAASFRASQRYNYTHREVWGDRVSYFITDMGQGSHTFTYYARATQNGVFTAMPTEVYAMYDLATWGRSASALLAVEP